MKLRALIAGVSLVAPAILMGQGKAPAPGLQIAAAVSPLPENLRAGARVLGYDASGKLVTLRPGTNQMTCLADDPAGKMFHVACYHNSLEAFMKRGRELHALKKSNESVDSVRLRDIRTGRYTMPSKQAALYQYFAPRDSVDLASGVISGAQYLYVVYVPYATYKSTGITEAPIEGGPWVMDPGKPWAHLMIQPQKPARIQLNVK
jgi:hypothetical protein